jgi:hypothetical protein
MLSSSFLFGELAGGNNVASDEQNSHLTRELDTLTIKNLGDCFITCKIWFYLNEEWAEK